MEIKTTDGTKDVASSGVGTAGLTLGIIGTGLAALGSNGNGLLGGLFGGNNHQVPALMAQIAKLEGQKYTDNAQLDLRDRLATLNEKIISYVLGIDKRVSALEVAGPLREQLIEQQITCYSNAANAAISALQNTVNGLVKTVIPATNICPQPMAQYNSWTAPTTTASGEAAS